MVDAGMLDLPLLPAVAAEVIQLTSSEDCDPRRLADVIRGDPALAGHLLHMANSVTLRGRTPVISLHQAMTRLGLAQVRELAFVVSCQNRVFKVRGREEQIKMLFLHSLATAMFAQEIARTRRVNVEEAFLAGLLHDVGKPVLLQAAADIVPHSCDIDEQELEDALTALHAYVGAELARRWGLSERLAEAIAHHHQPSASPTNVQGALIVRLADDVAYRVDGDDGMDLRMHPALAGLNLYPEDVDALLRMRDAVRTRLESMR
jgi:putative nucleotidyltransferase with HDIG domain